MSLELSPVAPPARPQSRSPGVPGAEALVAVLSGKGGVGKTNLVANLAIAAAALDARVLVVDGDLGLANLDVLLGLLPGPSVADLLAGSCSLEEALVEGPRGIHLLRAASGRADLPRLHGRELAGLLLPLLGAAARYDLVLIDAGAGVGPVVVSLAAACGRALLLTTPEPTSLADAYATRKVLAQEAPALPVELVVNGVKDPREAQQTHRRLDRLLDRFLGESIALRGHLPRDPRLAQAVAQQRAVVEAFPTAPCSRRLVALAEGLLRDVQAARSAALQPASRAPGQPARSAAPGTRDAAAPSLAGGPGAGSGGPR